ncbi:hypothetical protein TcasGA2_TC005197 [Tribolium castaneum]|uniref:Uncharacterized protein n=1 Tax=Tribolium castaneum TaxID=7070 RepID=D7EKZ9_TRICA|nr:hypothetical protein TcasGA2_TC005197 [Tribolium castaneum]
MPCKLFSRTSSPSLFVTGFNDWKNAHIRINEHEKSQEHCQYTKMFIDRSNVLGKIDTGLHKQFLSEKEYWVQILKRVVAAVKFLASRSLFFRGKSEKFGNIDNSNYMGVLELIAQFDSFLDDHINSIGNPGRETLEKLSLDIKNCRGQSYDNAGNRSGRYSGLQARILERNNLATFVPCAAHSLNLIGNSAAESCLMVTKFFGLVEELYNFLSASTQRWEIMEKHLVDEKWHKNLVSKRINTTRWSARADACKAFHLGYNSFRRTLQQISEDPLQTMSTKVEANGILKKLNELETGILTSFWTEILLGFDKVNKSLQGRDVDVSR